VGGVSDFGGVVVSRFCRARRDEHEEFFEVVAMMSLLTSMP